MFVRDIAFKIKEKFKNRMLKKIMILCLVVSLVLVGGCTNSNNTNGKPDIELAKCIGDRSTLYISAGCIACAHQKELFGDSFKYLNVIDCKKEPQKCIDTDILSVPTWVIEGEKYSGARPVEQLRQLTGC